MDDDLHLHLMPSIADATVAQRNRIAANFILKERMQESILQKEDRVTSGLKRYAAWRGCLVKIRLGGENVLYIVDECGVTSVFREE
jgi:hypothetical protein